MVFNFNATGCTVKCKAQNASLTLRFFLSPTAVASQCLSHNKQYSQYRVASLRTDCSGTRARHGFLSVVKILAITGVRIKTAYDFAIRKKILCFIFSHQLSLAYILFKIFSKASHLSTGSYKYCAIRVPGTSNYT